MSLPCKGLLKALILEGFDACYYLVETSMLLDPPKKMAMSGMPKATVAPVLLWNLASKMSTKIWAMVNPPACPLSSCREEVSCHAAEHCSRINPEAILFDFDG